jgi:hypothetical protein
MGQAIQILDRSVVGPVALFSTDRSITGQDGSEFVPGADFGPGLPGQLAADLFAAVDGLDRVFVASNQVVAHRSTGWDEASLASAEAAIGRFLIFYGGTG